MNKRVVVTGLGVAAPNGVGIPAFTEAIKTGTSGIRHDAELAALQFSCQIAGKPEVPESLQLQYLDPLELRSFNSNGILYGLIAGMDAWKDAQLPTGPELAPDWDSGTVFGAGSAGVDKLREAIYKVDALNVRRLGSTVVPQTMASGISAWLGGKLALANQVTTNSSACTTGAESVLMAYDRIRNGYAKRMLAGSTSDAGPYIWGGFDALKVCTFKHNDHPAAGSRPMSASASGFVPGSGAGALLLESLDSALERGATIYAEVLGGHVNSGAQRGDGSMTAPNSIAVQRCIREAVKAAGIDAAEIDAINGHLTATGKDALEVENWRIALDRRGKDFPYLNALKGMIGHCLSGSGSIELVAAVLQLHEGFLFPNINCEDLHPEITAIVDPEKIPRQLIYKELNLIAKASFGFGDVNACVILKKYK
ncbi:beta-ketoacyl-[acyl-carrier-protein] synthase family protein [Chitinophaga pinensis]|uniref:3-oxoacyl-[acyl-carrier-protein] synthase 1 n=1 Tax=Chitinophaga pinensis (strain ATCC 43595 / DSM 2588 / LMG 13176 / NBRC 15968 / NCIMB 11800 / UQM 2034) TaxID=485918 RepID=A0A979GTZ3_CHIPD|nr:beta-ketoacyl-[acyl-carrier-protein] synthase family protein [Chitinophaga pinensis]ACU62463.1 Beta-ketoacyl synthase [Chitinophaga pinensis DSM 2588]